MGIVISHYKDPYETTRRTECQQGLVHVAQIMSKGVCGIGMNSRKCPQIQKPGITKTVGLQFFYPPVNTSGCLHLGPYRSNFLSGFSEASYVSFSASFSLNYPP